MKRLATIGCLLLLFGGPPRCVAEGTAVELTTTAGEQIRGELLRVDDESVVLRNAPISEAPTADILRIAVLTSIRDRAGSRFQPLGVAWLADGGRLRPVGWQAGDDWLGLRLRDAASPLALTLDDLAVFVKPAVGASASADEAARSLSELASATGTDVLAVADPKSPGSPPASIEGKIESLSSEGVAFRFGQQSGTVRWDRIVGIAMAPIGASRSRDRIDDPSRPAVDVETVAGDRLPGDAVRYGTGEVTLLRGAGAIAFPASAIRVIDWSNRRVAYVHDWRLVDYGRPAQQSVRGRQSVPASAPSVIRMSGLPTLAIDRSLDEGSLTLDRGSSDGRADRPQRFDHGLAIRGPVFATFALPVDSQRVVALVGIAPSAVGDAVVSLWADGNELDRLRVRAGEAPKELDAEVSGVGSLTFVVEQGDDLDIGDIVHFADLRVVR